MILNSNLHYQIFKFVIDNSDISLNCLQHIQKRRNFDAKVTCHQPICLLLHAILSGVGVIIKGEVRSWSNLISEERVKFSEQNSENLMKIGWKIRKLWHYEVSQIFKKHFLTSRYEYANEWVDDVIASQFSIHFVHRNYKNFIFQLWKC